MKIIGIEEHFVTADILAAWTASPIGQEGTGGFDRGAGNYIPGYSSREHTLLTRYPSPMVCC